VGFKFVIALLAGSALFGQTPQPPQPPAVPPSLPTAPPKPPAPSKLDSIYGACTNIGTVAPAAFILSSVARGATDWHFTANGRRYDVSAAQTTAVTGAVVGVALVVRYVWPKTRKPIDIGLLLTSGAFAGVAYAQSQRTGH